MMNEFSSVFETLIRQRKILNLGRGEVFDMPKGTKVNFNFQTVAIYYDEQRNIEKELVIDDSKKSQKPMELFIGKEFKFPLWEQWVKHMRLNEVSQLNIDWRLCQSIYPTLSKMYRNFCDSSEKKKAHSKQHHCCGMTQAVGTGHTDLDQLIKNPPNELRFTLELVKVKILSETDNEIWLMNEDEMIRAIPALRQEGNQLFADKFFDDASQKYCKALAILDQLSTREKPGDEEWLRYDHMKTPLLSNLSQCELNLGQYYPAIQHASEALQRDAKNVKALFRRGRAHLAVGNFDQARQDFQQALLIDSSLEVAIQSQMAILDNQIKLKDRDDSRRFKGKLF